MGNNDNLISLQSSLHKIKRVFLSLLCCFPTSILALLLLLLLSYNGASIFCLHVPFPSKTAPESDSFSPEIVVRESTKKSSTSSSLSTSSSSVMYAVKEEILPSKLKTQLPLLQKSNTLNSTFVEKPKGFRKNRPIFKIFQPTALSKQFSVRAKEFFHGSSSKSSKSTCKLRFFMTWISSLESFGDREFFTIESVFKSHPNACLLIISTSMDSRRGLELLRPFTDGGFRVSAISPDFDYIFKNTVAEAWFDRLRKGTVDPGEVSLGQNISNLLRLAILYKFGGIYIDTDVIVLRNFSKLRNTIGAQTIDLETRNWSRLNNAVLVFDKKHPLLHKFIEEFALTFNGNRWGHNGPYLVSRVVSRLDPKPRFNFTILPPQAFYPVDWSRIQSLFHGFNGEANSKWYTSKLRQIREKSFAVHLWNKQSRNLKVEEGSIIDHIMTDCCIFCNSSVSAL
ncbi:Glycosyltransferase [Macleaya cordata]|uniref:Glycosyltransferase n=1 Tax=Macleaya cordata TaxID=56857 RepID=A0A200PQR4_MACCD|nr:Glycosyltransferase [Macleaya cordata]